MVNVDSYYPTSDGLLYAWQLHARKTPSDDDDDDGIDIVPVSIDEAVVGTRILLKFIETAVPEELPARFNTETHDVLTGLLASLITVRRQQRNERLV